VGVNGTALLCEAALRPNAISTALSGGVLEGSIDIIGVARAADFSPDAAATFLLAMLPMDSSGGMSSPVRSTWPDSPVGWDGTDRAGGISTDNGRFCAQRVEVELARRQC
jgi:hypothetical protein